jgi:RHS repeat-associated protein
MHLGGMPVAQIDIDSLGQESIVYLHTDHLATPRLATDQNQTIVWKWESDAYGATPPTGTVTVNLRFPGQYFDAESGWYYNWNRYYLPREGRYLTSDPIGLGSGVNTYAYVGGNPLKGIDPYGLEQNTGCISACAAIGGVAGGTAGYYGGGFLGGALGGSAGTIAGPGGTGVGTYLGAGAGSRVGAEYVGYAGAILGTALGNILCPLLSEADTGPKRGTEGASGDLTTVSGNVYPGNSTNSSKTGGDPRAPMDPEVQKALDDVKKPSPFHGDCCEIDAMNKAKNAGEDLRGAKMGPVTKNATGKTLPPGQPH